ncbi:MAG: hypothetical protein R3F62_10975 [Planctomycetota bacterium]
MKKLKKFFRPGNMLKVGAVSLGVTVLAGLALFKGPAWAIEPAAYVMLAGAGISLLAFGAAAIGGLWNLGKKLFGKKKKSGSDAAPVVAGAGGAAVAAGALALGGGAVPPAQPNAVPIVQAEESMAYPSLEEAGFEILPTAEEAAAAGDPVAGPIAAPIVTDVTLGDPVAPSGPAFTGLAETVQ